MALTTLALILVHVFVLTLLPGAQTAHGVTKVIIWAR